MCLKKQQKRTGSRTCATTWRKQLSSLGAENEGGGVPWGWSSSRWEGGAAHVSGGGEGVGFSEHEKGPTGWDQNN